VAFTLADEGFGLPLLGDIANEAMGVMVLLIIEEIATKNHHGFAGVIFAVKGVGVFFEEGEWDGGIRGVLGGIFGVEAGKVLADEFFSGVAREIDFGLIDELDESMGIEPMDSDGREFHKFGEFGGLLAESGFGTAKFEAFFLVVHCPSDGWSESFEFIFEEVIDGPFFQAGDGFFWAERPRNHNDGGLGASGKGSGNGGDAIVVVQIMVAKNDVKVFEGEGVFEGGLAIDQS